jgi:hypothetical protein
LKACLGGQRYIYIYMSNLMSLVIILFNKSLHV